MEREGNNVRASEQLGSRDKGPEELLTVGPVTSDLNIYWLGLGLPALTAWSCEVPPHNPLDVQILLNQAEGGFECFLLDMTIQTMSKGLGIFWIKLFRPYPG